MVPELPGMVDAQLPVVTEHVAMIDCLPADFKTAGKVAVPLVRVAPAGRMAAESLLENCTTPENPVKVLLAGSCAVTVNCKEVPAVAEAGAVTRKCGEVQADTGITALPLMEEVAASVAMRLWLPGVFKVAERVAAPLIRVASAGSTAMASELVKCTGPA